MRGRPYYRSRLLVTGLALFVLGAGNALIGSQKLGQYQQIVAEGHARGYLADGTASERILRPLDDEAERFTIGRSKVDLYLVVLNGGLLMMGVGILLTVIAWIRLRSRRAGTDALAASEMSARRARAR